MENKIILEEGLKGALARGESLKQAMISFYNAGYKKEEIEKAARALQIQQQKQPRPPQTQQIQPKPIQKPLKPIKKLSQPKSRSIQRVSNYGQQPKPKKKSPLIILIIFLVMLLGALTSLFLFKEQILEFLDNSEFLSGLLN